ncbi:hypothetical protein [Nocardioides sp. NPDC006303]|uniref:hypothetical protein n=1 Tax=Nocardioides sp. NPDC006303 TaxID=3156747 RepID=UPI0033AC0FDA
MTENHGAVINPDIHNSSIGVIAEAVHNSTFYVTPPNASPEEIFESGMSAISGGRFDRARECIEEAIANGFDNSKVRFHWMIAMLSGRSQRDLSNADRRDLKFLLRLLPTFPEDDWKQALIVVLELIGYRQAEADAPSDWRARIEALALDQQNLINDHLDRVMPAAVKATMWKARRSKAAADQFRDGRSQRIRMYFEPEPAPPRTLEPHPYDAVAAQAAFPLRAALFTAAALGLAVLAMITHPLAAITEIAVAVAAGVAATHFGHQWADHVWALKPSPTHQLPSYTVHQNGFTTDVRRSFDAAFATHTPRTMSQSDWLSRTDEDRARLAHEVARLYRESRTTVEGVEWLIQHLAERAKAHPSIGASENPAQSVSSKWSKVLCLSSLTVLATAAVAILITIFSNLNPSHIGLSVVAAAVAFGAGHAAVSAALEVRGEHRRVAREKAERDAEKSIREAAYARWKSGLDETRPTEREMEMWLNSDKTLFIADALDTYRLDWDDLITYTFLVTPKPRCLRARITRGPWRYSQYSFRLFLVTLEGVREVSTDVDVLTAKRGQEERSSYRFDALSSVQVTEDNRHRYNLELTLTNGPSRQILIKDADAQQVVPEDNDLDFTDEREFSKVNLNATGFVHTFHLLEAIAADGKQWAARHVTHPASGTASSA